MRILITAHAEVALDGILGGNIPLLGRIGLRKFYSSYKTYKRRLLSTPYLGTQEELLDEKYRSVVVHPLVKMIYSVDGDTIYIHDFWNTLRDPQYLSARVKQKHPSSHPM